MRSGKKIDYQKIILTTVAVAGLLTVAMVVPNCLQLLKIFDQRKYQRKIYANKVLARLLKQGFVKLERNRQGQKCVTLTNKGRRELEHYELRESQIKKPRRWDNKYRVIIFDIKEWKRGVRDDLRRWLIRLGFVKLQNSVWVHPYECQEVVILLKSHFKIGKEVLYLTVDSIENDHWLKKEFGLN